jgi:presenilin-like A22 family membrane protease
MKPYVQIALFFALTQALGIYSGVVLIRAAPSIPELQDVSVLPQIGISGDPASSIAVSLALLIGYILAGAALVIIAARLFKGRLFFQLLEFAVVFSASAIVFAAIGLAALSLDIWASALMGGALGFCLALLKMLRDEAKNAAAIISSAGVAAIFGFSTATFPFGPMAGFVLMCGFVVLLSAYDYIAVFKTRHMIEMARELSSRQLSFAVTAKAVPARQPHEKREEYVERAMEEGERLDLGTGDLSVPAMLSVSAFPLGQNGLAYSLAIAAGSTAALYLLLRFVSKKRVFLPALPPICLGGMLALLAVKLAGL